MKKSELLSRIVSLELAVQKLQTQVEQLWWRRTLSAYTQPTYPPNQTAPFPPAAIYGDGAHNPPITTGIGGKE